MTTTSSISKIELIDFRLTDHMAAATICDAADRLIALVDAFDLLAYEDSPESDEWTLACRIGEIEMYLDDDDLVQVARLMPKAVRLANELIVVARR